MSTYLDFEKPLFEIHQKIEELKLLAAQGNMDVSEEMMKLEKKMDKMREKIFSKSILFKCHHNIISYSNDNCQG